MGKFTKGTKGLLKRLKVHTPKKAAAPPATDSKTTQAEIGAEAETRRSALQRELAHELEIEDAGERPVVRNRWDLSLAVGFDAQRWAIGSLDARVAAQDARIAAKIAAQDAKIAKQDMTIALLQGRITDLTTSFDAYKTLRNRFISTFRRDVLKRETEDDRRIIAAGNSSAHCGDAVVDASLYDMVGPGARKDVFSFTELYGLDPLVVPSLGERDMGKDYPRSLG